MILLNDKDFCINCDCGTKFIANESDFKIDLVFNNRVVVCCPKCELKHYVIYDSFDTEKTIIEGEIIKDDNN